MRAEAAWGPMEPMAPSHWDRAGLAEHHHTHQLGEKGMVNDDQTCQLPHQDHVSQVSLFHPDMGLFTLIYQNGYTSTTLFYQLATPTRLNQVQTQSQTDYQLEGWTTDYSFSISKEDKNILQYSSNEQQQSICSSLPKQLQT